MASDLIIKAGINAEDEVKEALSSYFIWHLGDPRTPGADIHWGSVEEKGKTILSQWLSSKDLEFFFPIELER